MYHYDNESTHRIIFDHDGKVVRYEKWDEQFDCYLDLTSQVHKILSDITIAEFLKKELTANQSKIQRDLESQFESARGTSHDDTSFKEAYYARKEKAGA